MMRPNLPLLLSVVSVLTLAAPVSADVLDDAAIQASPQYYLMSLPPAPVGEIADAVLGDALGLPFKVDPDVDATMPFKIDGLYSPKALARELGYRLWNADIALVEKPASGLWLIPKAKLTMALAEGAVLVSPPVGTVARQPTPPASVPEGTAVANAAATWSWLAWLLAGWAAGAATVTLWSRLLRRRRPVPVLLAGPDPISSNDDDHDDLIIPVFPSSTVKLKL